MVAAHNVPLPAEVAAHNVPLPPGTETCTLFSALAPAPPSKAAACCPLLLSGAASVLVPLFGAASVPNLGIPLASFPPDISREPGTGCIGSPPSRLGLSRPVLGRMGRDTPGTRLPPHPGKLPARNVPVASPGPRFAKSPECPFPYHSVAPRNVELPRVWVELASARSMAPPSSSIIP